MTDSSSPGQFPVFGDLIIGPNFSAQKWDQIHVSRDIKYREEDLMPTLFHTPITKNWNMKIINDYKQEYYDRCTLQNLLVFNKGLVDISNFCTKDIELLGEVIPKDLYSILQSIHEMFESDDPMHIYEKYRGIYINYGGQWIASQHKEVMNNFFEL